MIILGVSPPAHESAVGIVVDGKLVAAAAEERFTREKNQGGFPRRALEAVLRMAGVSPEEVDAVTLAWLDFPKEQRLKLEAYLRNVPYAVSADSPIAAKLGHLLNYSRNVLLDPNWVVWRRAEKEILQPLRELGLEKKVVYVDHHAAHVASAYYASGFDRALGVSLDGYGSGAAGSFYLCQGGKMRLLQRIPYPHSLGTFYRRVTQALGFKPNRHEGKIVGLAAFGDSARLYDRVMSRFDLARDDHYRIKWPQDPFEDRRIAEANPREDVAAAYQRVLEDVATRYVGRYLESHRLSHLVCAGGVFANVKMNQRVMELPGVEQIFVFPAMGDGGVGVGAALFLAAETHGLQPFRLRDAYLGPAYSERDLEAAVRASGLPFRVVPDIDREVAELVAKSSVVARFDGKMEFGPRALGNRSILYPATDPAVNKWLNDRLRRTEFMPFAPVSLREHAHRLYKDFARGAMASEFMTVTFDCTEEMRRQSPAAVHVDGTARPQVVTPEINPGYYRILEHYSWPR